MQFGGNQENEEVAYNCSHDVHQQRYRQVWTEYAENGGHNHKSDVKVPKVIISDLSYEQLNESGSANL